MIPWFIPVVGTSDTDERRAGAANPPQKGRMKMIKVLVEYIGRNGQTIVKAFTSIEEATAFTIRLDERIAKGTCGGYIMTEI